VKKTNTQLKKAAEDFQKKWAKMVSRAWSDEVFKKRLLQNPKEVLEENGLMIPADFRIKIHENIGKDIILVLPPNLEEDFSEEELRKVSAGKGFGSLIM
jgi:hypothetical protein